MVLIIYLSFAFSVPFFHKANCYKAEKDIIEKPNFAFRQALGKKAQSLIRRIRSSVGRKMYERVKKVDDKQKYWLSNFKTYNTFLSTSRCDMLFSF